MLSPQLRTKVHELWTLFWTAGLSNPLVAIEQITYLLFIRQLEALDQKRVADGKPSIYGKVVDRKKGIREHERCKWSVISGSSNIDVPFIRDTVFAWLRGLEEHFGSRKTGEESTLGKISDRLGDAYFALDPNKTETLKSAIKKIDDLFRALDTRSVNADIMGDLFEHLLDEIKESGKNGQFRTPRHVIRFMVEMLDPEMRPDVRILDPACGSGGFLVNTLQHWRTRHTDNDSLKLEWDGTAHEVRPTWPRNKQPPFAKMLHGFDNDRTMVRIAWMNLILHGIESPEVQQLDALSKALDDQKDESEKRSGTYDYILANPPFTGNVDTGDLSQNRARFEYTGTGEKAKPITTKSELLFVWLMLDLLKTGGRAAVIVPDGVLFGNTNAHRELRRQLLFQHTLECVVSLPANMFQPYSGVKTSILFFQKIGAEVEPGDDPRTREVWFYEIVDEAFTLDQRRKERPGQDNDLWDAQIKHRAWETFRTGEDVGQAREESVSKDYHQPRYWQERWRQVDDATLKIFPDQAGNKDHTFALHELWPGDFPDVSVTGAGSKAYDEVVLDRVRPEFEKIYRRVVAEEVRQSYVMSQKPDREKALKAAQTATRKLGSELQKLVRERSEYHLDREFAQHGMNALKAVIREQVDRVEAWVDEIPVERPPRKRAVKMWDDLEELEKLLPEFAKLDGYDVWRRSLEITPVGGKLQCDEDGQPVQVKTRLSWIVPTREWARRDTWGIDPKTGKEIEKPTHSKSGQVSQAYLNCPGAIPTVCAPVTLSPTVCRWKTWTMRTGNPTTIVGRK